MVMTRTSVAERLLYATRWGCRIPAGAFVLSMGLELLFQETTGRPRTFSLDTQAVLSGTAAMVWFVVLTGGRMARIHGWSRGEAWEPPVVWPLKALWIGIAGWVMLDVLIAEVVRTMIQYPSVVIGQAAEDTILIGLAALVLGTARRRTEKA